MLIKSFEFSFKLAFSLMGVCATMFSLSVCYVMVSSCDWNEVVGRRCLLLARNSKDTAAQDPLTLTAIQHDNHLRRVSIHTGCSASFNATKPIWIITHSVSLDTTRWPRFHSRGDKVKVTLLYFLHISISIRRRHRDTWRIPLEILWLMIKSYTHIVNPTK